MIARLLRDQGMIVVLLALCILFSSLTIRPQMPEGAAAVADLVQQVTQTSEPNDDILAVAAENTNAAELVRSVAAELAERGYQRVATVVAEPRDLRLALDELHANQATLSAVVVAGNAARWRVVNQIPSNYPHFSDFELIEPTGRLWPDFLKRSNLLAIVDRIVVIAVIAVGMTMVIITAGIDLSVGSLIALSAVIATLVMKRLGGLEAPWWATAVGFLAGVAGVAAVGAVGGWIVARFKVAPFITTLSVMMMARGFAFLLTGGFSIYQVPASLPWLGQGRTLGVPNTVILLAVLYLIAHVFMARTRMGRYIYAVGGNEQAARISGVPVGTVIVFVYTICAVLAGLGGCIQASQLNSGTPNMGVMYELYVIAAVVVGGTSLSGGTGTIFGTLIGAFIISVIQNGMNLLGMESYTQQVVLGAVILAAVLLDKVRVGGRFVRFSRR